MVLLLFWTGEARPDMELYCCSDPWSAETSVIHQPTFYWSYLLLSVLRLTAFV